MDTVVIFVFLAVWIGFIGVGAVVLMRMNAQVNRLQGSPAPKEAFEALLDAQVATDIIVKGMQRQVAANEAELADTKTRINRLAAREAAFDKRNQQALARKAVDDYILRGAKNDEPSTDETPPPVDQSTGEVIDYR